MVQILIVGVLIAIVSALVFGPVVGGIALAITLLAMIPGIGIIISCFGAIAFLAIKFGSDKVQIAAGAGLFLALAWYFISQRIKKYIERDPVFGLIIISVEAGGPAEIHGLQSGDILYSINGTLLKTEADLADCLSSHRNTPYQLNYQRNGRDLALTMRSSSLGASFKPR